MSDSISSGLRFLFDRNAELRREVVDLRLSLAVYRLIALAGWIVSLVALVAMRA